MNSLKDLNHRLLIYKKIHAELHYCIKQSLFIHKKLGHKSFEELSESYDLIDSFKKLKNEEEDILKNAKLILHDDSIINNYLQKILNLMLDFLNKYDQSHYLTEELIHKFSKIIKFIIQLDSQFSKKESYSEDHLKNIKKILSASPKEVFNKGYLFRGVSSKELDLLKNGYPIESHVESKNTLEGHIADRCNDVNVLSRFISLTTKREVAEHFGKLVIFDKKKLIGNILTPDQLVNKLSTKTHHFIKKNNEFILEPSAARSASIPASAVVWISKAA